MDSVKDERISLELVIKNIMLHLLFEGLELVTVKGSVIQANSGEMAFWSIALSEKMQ